MIRQDDKWLNDNSEFKFKKYGCLLFCLAYIGVMFGTYVFSRKTFLKDCKILLKQQAIDTDCTVLKWDAVLECFQISYKLKFINGSHKIDATYQTSPDELQIFLLQNNYNHYEHFVIGTPNNYVLFDPLGVSFNQKCLYDGSGRIKNKRILK